MKNSPLDSTGLFLVEDFIKLVYIIMRIPMQLAG